VGLQVEGNLNMERFNKFMTGLLQTKVEDLYRSKGVVSMSGDDTKFVFQGVHEQIDFGASNSKWVEGEPRTNKLVFIGRNLDRAVRAVPGRLSALSVP
jgi:G3E family GTPase